MGTHVARARSHPRRWAVPCRSPGLTWTPPRTFPPSTSSSPWRSVAQSLSLSALYCVEKLRAKPAGDGARADDAGFGGPPRATDTASPALYDDAGWVNPTERPSMRGRHCAGLTGCNTKNHPIRKTSQENRRNETPFSDPSFPKLFSGYERKRPIRRQRSTLATAPWRGGGGGWSDIRREGECRIARRSKIYFPIVGYLFVTTGLTRRWERRCSTVVFHTRHEGSVYLPRLPGSTPDLRGDPPRDFRSRFVTSSELREIRLRFEAGSHGSKHQLWNPPLERGPSLPTSCPRRKPCFEASHDVRVKPNERVERTNQDE